MKIKTNIRAGSGGSANSGGASGAGHNSTGTTPDVSNQPVSPPPPPPVYYSRCVGI